MPISLVFLGALAAAADVLPGARAARQAKPNFVVLFGDDLGHYDTAIFNDAAPTPNLATLAKNGLLLDRHYVFRFVDEFMLLWVPAKVDSRADEEHVCAPHAFIR